MPSASAALAGQSVARAGVPVRARPRVVQTAGGRYLSEAYYRSEDVELAGDVAPVSCADALDAFGTVVALGKAALAGLPVPEWWISEGEVEPPCLVERVGPRPGPAMVVRDARDRRRHRAPQRDPRTEVLCCQRLRAGSAVVTVRVVHGSAANERFREWAEAVDRVFHLRAASLRLIVTGSEAEFSGLRPLRVGASASARPEGGASAPSADAAAPLRA